MFTISKHGALAFALACTLGLTGYRTVLSPCGVTIAEEGGSPLTAENFRELAIDRVLAEGARTRFAHVEIEGNAVRVRSEIGEYIFRIGQNSSPLTGMPIVKVSKGQVRVEVDIGFSLGRGRSAVQRLQGLVRSAFRADPFLHPHLLPPNVSNWETVLSYPQSRAVNALLQMEQRPGSGLKRGLVMPVGIGKTVTSAVYARSLQSYLGQSDPVWQQPPNILFIVNNGTILDDATSTYRRVMGLSEKSIAKMYGDRRRPKSLAGYKMVASSRASAIINIDLIHQALRNRKQNWLIVLDEAQHIGKGQGEFRTLLDAFEQDLASNIRILTLSATLWHQDRAIISDILNGNVWGPFLEANLLRQLQAGTDLPDLSRVQLLEGIRQGYLSPVEMLDILEADDFSIRSPGDSRGAIQKLGQSILRDRRPGETDHGVIFAPNTTLANEWSDTLSEVLGAGSEVRPYHSGEESEADTYDWFRNRGKYDTEAERRKHKYIVVCDLLREGADMPEVNVVALMRSFRTSVNSFANLLQSFGRATRVNIHKTGFRAYDGTGFSISLRQSIPDIFAEQPEKHRGRTRKRSEVRFHDREMTASDFRERFLEFMPSEGSFPERFPEFNIDEFRAMMDLMHWESANAGVSGFTGNHGPARFLIFLAEQLPQSDERDEYTSRLGNFPNSAKTDGAEAKAGRFPAVERVHDQVRGLAELVLTDAQPHGFDLKNCTKLEGFTALLDAIIPNRPKRVFTSPERRNIFLDPQRGAYWALRANADVFGVDFAVDGPKTYMTVLAERARQIGASNKSVTDYKRSLNDSALYLWGNDESRPPRNQDRFVQWDYNRTRFHRLLSAWEGVYEILPPNEAIPRDVASLAQLDETLVTLERLAGFPLPSSLTESETREFREGLSTMAKHVKRFGIRAFSEEHGARLFLIKLAQLLPQSPQRDSLLHALSKGWKRWGWTERDGGSALRYPKPLRRIWVAYYALTQIARKEGLPIPENVRSAEGIQQVLNALLTKIAIPVFSQSDFKTFADKSEGSLIYLNSESSTLGASNFVREYGAQKTIVGLAQALPPWTPGREQAIQVLSDPLLWGWKPADGSTAAQEEPASSTRIEAALYWIAALTREAYPEMDFVPENISSIYELARVHSLLLWGVAIPYLTNEEAKEFQSKGLAFVFERAQELGLSSPKNTFAAKEVGLSLFRSQKREYHVQRLKFALASDLLWDWKVSDLNQATQSQYFERSCRKVHRMLFANAVIGNLNREPQEVWELSQTQSGLERLFPQPLPPRIRQKKTAPSPEGGGRIFN